jgi:carbon storage regulator
MLVLSRKLGEKIVIGDNITLTVVKIDRNQVRLGIDAPKNLEILREEIIIERNTRQAEAPIESETRSRAASY